VTTTLAGTSDTSSPQRNRLLALDGLRGIAILLVVLSHGWELWPTDQLTKIKPFDGLFWSGNLAVTTFFVVGGFVVTRGLLAQTEHGRLNPFRFYARRIIRIGVQLYPLLLVVLATSGWHNGIDHFTRSATRDSVLSAGSYTWNWYLMNHALTARSDLGHLWYLSVEQQFYVVLAIVLALLSRYRRLLIVGVVALIIATAVWRAHVLHVDGWWDASLRTTTRMDGLLLGVLAAMAVPHPRRYDRYSTAALWVSGLTMVALVLAASQKGDLDYLRAQGLIFDVAAAVFVVGLFLAPVASPLARTLSAKPLCILGAASLTIYVWHYPLFWAVSRHTTHWGWVPRTLLAFGLLIVVVIIVQLLLERPTKRWLARHLQPRKRHGPAHDTQPQPVPGQVRTEPEL
jgi:peptidoglycan/LPS O-acetylase OafA/YrhL